MTGVIATTAAGMDASAWAAWVQAVFSILAICAGFLTMYLQNRHADKAREAERARGAEVVAYRLSGWIADAGVRLEMALTTCQDRQSKVSSGPPRSLPVVIDELRLNMPSGIEAVLPDLHYLLLGSGDIAQLDHHARGYEAWLDGTLKINTQPGGGPSMIAAYNLRDVYTRAEKQLTAMKALHANAQRHIGPLIEQGIKRDGGEGRVDP